MKCIFPGAAELIVKPNPPIQMKNMRLDPGKASPDIYVILRVYNLTSDNIGMRILVDPATMKRNGELVFTAESYTVLQKDGPDSDPDLA